AGPGRKVNKPPSFFGSRAAPQGSGQRLAPPSPAPLNFSEKSITRNARIDGKWGMEEKTIPYFPFIAGDTFKMELLCEHQQIKVLLDGRQICDFTHRIQPLNLVKALQITGDVNAWPRCCVHPRAW
uniref:Galectin n=1 Tax=Coturnix japonica TaxID=93934 RepID=A0A8C2U498_COTJA